MNGKIYKKLIYQQFAEDFQSAVAIVEIPLI